MDGITNLVIIAFFGQVVASAIAGAFLLFRAVKTRYYYLAFMGIGLLLQATSILSPGNIGRALLNFNYPVALVFFVKEAYFKGKPRATAANVIISVVLALKALQVIETIVLDMTIPATAPVPEDKLGAYYFHVVVAFALLGIAFSWYFAQARKTLGESRRNKLPLWAIKRNQFITWSAGIFAATPALWFLFPTTPGMFESPWYYIVGSAGLTLTVLFSVLIMLAWVTPESIKRLMDPKQLSTKEILARFDLVPGMASSMKPLGTPGASTNSDTDTARTVSRRFNSPEIIRIVDYIGQYVASITGRPAAALKGLLLISIEKELGEQSVHNLTFSELRAVINNTFKAQLSQFLVSDVENTFGKINTFLGDNQANFMALIV
ncbi:MAG: hypothetical protein GYA24_18430 [Candidatus Lokiarchaeota archaeon]|nr:hypothetical protein [Candidatus Lokiarchaeota archaeon]